MNQEEFDSVAMPAAEGEGKRSEQRIVTTYFTPAGEGKVEGWNVAACARCKVVLEWFGVRDVHAGKAA